MKITNRLFALSALLIALPAWPAENMDTPAVEGVEITAFIEGTPGGVYTENKQLEATVQAIDAETRRLSLKDDQGNNFRVKVGKEAVNFDQIRVGDRLRAVSTLFMIVSLADKSREKQDGSAAVVVSAEKGDKPAMAAAERVRATATVTAVDLEKRTATLRFPDDTVKTFGVRDDVKLGPDAVGAKIVFETLETYTLRILKP